MGADVAAVSGEEVVEADDVIVLSHQGIDEIGADEAGTTSDEDAGVVEGHEWDEILDFRF